MSQPLYDSLQRAVKILDAHPELRNTTTLSFTEDSLWVSPWLRGAPLTGLLRWHDAMSDVEREVETITTTSAGSYYKVTVRGMLEDLHVVAQTVTFQEMTAGALTEAELRRAAAQEDPY